MLVYILVLALRRPPGTPLSSELCASPSACRGVVSPALELGVASVFLILACVLRRLSRRCRHFELAIKLKISAFSTLNHNKISFLRKVVDCANIANNVNKALAKSCGRHYFRIG